MAGIYGFTGGNRWLSNMALISPFVYDSIEFRTVENYYQAMKFLDRNHRVELSKMSARESKARARTLSKNGHERENWANIKEPVMRYGLNIKFSQEEFSKRLLLTGDCYIEETNWHGDTFWGVFDGCGENKLGLDIMAIRDCISRGVDLIQQNQEISRPKIQKTIVVNMKLEPYDCYIGRGSPFGNLYPVHNGAYDLETSLAHYHYDFHQKIKNEKEFKDLVNGLKGKKLGCVCKRKKSTAPDFAFDKNRCHGDIIVDYLESEES